VEWRISSPGTVECWISSLVSTSITIPEKCPANSPVCLLVKELHPIRLLNLQQHLHALRDHSGVSDRQLGDCGEVEKMES